MEILLTIAALSGLLASGFLIGDMAQRWRERAERIAFAKDWRDTLGKVSAVHNDQTIKANEMFDRLAAIDMAVRGVKK